MFLSSLPHSFGGLVVVLLSLALLAVVSCHPDEVEEDGGSGGGSGGGWKGWETNDGEPDRLQILEPGRFPDEDEVNYYTANIEDFFEGDIILTPNQRKEILKDKEEEEEHNINERAVVRDSLYKWPNAVIPYVISSSLPSRHVEAIQSAMRTYMNQTCIRFEQWRGQSSYVRFIRGRGCYSYVGRVGGAQEISIGDGCQFKGIVMHEIFHALGRWHEHSRPDRGNYITINYNNIRNGLQDQFYRLRSTSANTNGIAYDYSSLMHYSAYAFTINRRPTIIPRDSRVGLDSLGQRGGLSNKDYQHVANLYCNQVSTPQWSSWGNWGQCSASCGTGSQTRTRSCQGTGCSGSGTETRSCSSDGPDCAGRWTSWRSWGSCAPSCGTNRTRSRSRSCQGQGGCTGESTQRESCANSACPTSEWTPWGPCTRVCNGYQIRRRSCCSSPYYQFRTCSVGPCSSRIRLDEEEQHNPQQQQQEPQGENLGMEPISAGHSMVCTVSLVLGSAMTTLATLIN